MKISPESLNLFSQESQKQPVPPDPSLLCLPGHLWTDRDRNLSIITLTSVTLGFRPPCILFLRHLAIINLGNSTVIAPKMLINFLVKKHTTSFYECAIQLGGFLVFIVAEIFILL